MIIHKHANTSLKEERLACFRFPGWKFCRNSLRQETHLFLYFYVKRFLLRLKLFTGKQASPEKFYARWDFFFPWRGKQRDFSICQNASEDLSLHLRGKAETDARSSQMDWTKHIKEEENVCSGCELRCGVVWLKLTATLHMKTAALLP